MRIEDLDRDLVTLFEGGTAPVGLEEVQQRSLKPGLARSRPWTVVVAAFAVVALGGLTIGLLTSPAQPPATTVPAAAPTTAAPTTTVRATPATPFVPPTRSAGGLTYLNLTLLDGSHIELAYPEDLDLTSLGMEVQTVGLVGEDAARTIGVHHGSPSSFVAIQEGVMGQSHLVKTYEGFPNPVEFWEFPEGGIAFMVYDFDPWTVYVWDGTGNPDPSMGDNLRAIWARSLEHHIWDPGFLTLGADPPLQLVEAAADPGPDGPDIRIEGADGGLLVFVNDCDRMRATLDQETYGKEVFAYCDEATNTLFFVSGDAEIQQRVHENLIVNPPPPGVSLDPPPVLDQQTDSRIYFTTDFDLTIVDVDARTVETMPLPELAPGDPLYRLVRRGGNFVFYGQDADGPAVYTLNPGNPSAPVLIDDDAWFFVPSVHRDRVWIAGLDPTSPETVRALDSIWEITVDGELTVGPVPPPGGRWPVAEVDDGLLFQGEDVLEIWDPSIEQFVNVVPGPFPVATWGNRLVSCVRCDEIQLIDLDNGTERTVELPVGVSAVDGYGGSFSPDGRYVAVPATLSPPPTSPHAEIALVLIEFETGQATLIPGTVGASAVEVEVDWSSNGDWMFAGPITVGSAAPTIVAYRPGEATAYRVDVELSDTYYGMASD